MIEAIQVHITPGPNFVHDELSVSFCSLLLKPCFAGLTTYHLGLR